MSIVTLKVPDIGGAEDAEVIELLVGIGDEVDSGQGLLVLESDKASMEIPAETAGVIKEGFVSNDPSIVYQHINRFTYFLFRVIKGFGYTLPASYIHGDRYDIARWVRA